LIAQPVCQKGPVGEIFPDKRTFGIGQWMVCAANDAEFIGKQIFTFNIFNGPSTGGDVQIHTFASDFPKNCDRIHVTYVKMHLRMILHKALNNCRQNCLGNRGDNGNTDKTGLCGCKFFD